MLKIENYNNNIDPTDEVGSEKLKSTTMKFTSNENDLRDVDFYIVTVQHQ